MISLSWKQVSARRMTQHQLLERLGAFLSAGIELNYA